MPAKFDGCGMINSLLLLNTSGAKCQWGRYWKWQPYKCNILTADAGQRLHQQHQLQLFSHLLIQFMPDLSTYFLTTLTLQIMRIGINKCKQVLWILNFIILATHTSCYHSAILPLHQLPYAHCSIMVKTCYYIYLLNMHYY